MAEFKDPAFDKLLDSFGHNPDAVRTGMSTVRSTGMFGIGGSRTTVFQSFRVPDSEAHRGGDYLFIEQISDAGLFRVVLGPEETNCAARHREALTDKSRSRAAKRTAQERMERGETPAFLRGRKRAK